MHHEKRKVERGIGKRYIKKLLSLDMRLEISKIKMSEVAISENSRAVINCRHIALEGFPNTARAVPYSPEREKWIQLHPLMQRELARQDADLKLLASNPSLHLLKAQWRAPAKSNIDL